MKKLKSFILIVIVSCLLSGCLGAGIFTPTMFEKMESCVECISGVHEWESIKSALPVTKEVVKAK